jgi:hypothetical protein
MSSVVLVTVVLFLLMAQRLADIYAGGHYVCPSCGARSESTHSPGCPWGSAPS